MSSSFSTEVDATTPAACAAAKPRRKPRKRAVTDEGGTSAAADAVATLPSLSKSASDQPAIPADAATLVIRDAIRAFVPAAIRELARLAHEANSEQARISAINALIDRGYGTLKQATDGDDAAHDITVRFVTPVAGPTAPQTAPAKDQRDAG